MTSTNGIATRAPVAIVFIGVTLAAIHFFIPPSIQDQLAFEHSHAAPWMFWTSAYVHNSVQHLLNNLTGFGIGAAVTYQLSNQQGRRRWFWVTTASFLLVLPVLVNLTSYLAFQWLSIQPTSRGFSGVVAGYVGFILVALSGWVSNRYNSTFGNNVGIVVFLVLMGEIYVIYADGSSRGIEVLLALGAALVLGSVLRHLIQQHSTGRDRTRVAADAGFVAGVTVLLVVFIWGLFPTQIVDGWAVTNIIAHFAGVSWGVVLAVVSGYQRWDFHIDRLSLPN